MTNLFTLALSPFKPGFIAMLLMLLLSIMPNLVQAQAPDKFRYQAVARNESGTLVTGEIGIRISLRENGPDGLIRYTETHQAITTPQGVFHLDIGGGSIINGDMNEVDWSQNEYWLEVELKPASDSDYTKMGSTQLLSVPYAMYARSSGDDVLAGQGIEITNGVINNTGDLSETNEMQSLEVSGNQLSISGGNSVSLPTGAHIS